MNKDQKYPFLVEFTGSPESGKTTCIKSLIKRLESEGLKVHYVQESAEIISSQTNIPKSSYEATCIMRLLSIIEIIKSKYEDYDLVLIDRGLLDGIFYSIKFLTDYPDMYNNFSSLVNFLNSLKEFANPDVLIVFKVTPEIAIKRKGGEGSIVTKKFIKNYNSLLDAYLSSLNRNSYYIIDTSTLSINQVSDEIFTTILYKFWKKNNMNHKNKQI